MTEDVTRPATLTELAVRAANGSGEDRELDAEIAVAVDGGEIMWKTSNGTMERYPVRRYASEMHIGGFASAPVPAFTTSVDAVLSIMPEGTFWQVGNDGAGPDPSKFAGRVGVPEDEGPYLTFRRVVSSDAPRALLSALLFALAEIGRVKGDAL